MLPIKMYTDGSSDNIKKKDAGWAFVMNVDSKPIVFYGHLPPPSTNNIGEMFAVAFGLRISKLLKRYCIIYSDSEYTINSLGKWRMNWETNGMPNKNQELIRMLWRANDEHGKAELRWVKGHSGNKGNELADEYAGKGRKKDLVNMDGKYIKLISFNDMQEAEDYLLRLGV